MEIDPPEFLSKDDEIQYWMELAHQMHQRFVTRCYTVYPSK